MSDHENSKNKNNMRIRSTSRVMNHSQILKTMQYGEHHQRSKLAKHRVIPGGYNPWEEEDNINNIDKLHFTKFKTPVPRVTIKTL